MAWEPTRAVEIVVPAGAGGATDQMARMFQAAIQNNNLLQQPTVVSLKGAASGGEGLLDMMSSSGDPHKFIIANAAIYTLPFTTNLPFDWRDLTPVAVVAQDQFILWVNSQSAHMTAREFLDAAKAAGENYLKMGGTGSLREDEIISSALSRIGEVTFAYVPYRSGGEAATQLVGGHTDANVNNPSENAEVWRAGQVRPLCVFGAERIPYDAPVTADAGWDDIPTCREEGVNFAFTMLRGIFLPGGVDEEHTTFYRDLFERITQTNEFKEYAERQALTQVFITGEDMTQFLEQDEATHHTLMTEAGFTRTN
jgi:tripartite-type tricarboxylate transporter receptor subunit TctC